MTPLPCHIVWDPAMSPFSIFGFEVRYYSLCWIIGLTAGYFIMQHLYKKQKVSMELFEPLFMYCFLGILIGARLGHCIFYEPDYYFNHIAEMFLPIKETAEGWKFIGYQGLASHGGTIGLFTALWLYTKHTKLSFASYRSSTVLVMVRSATFTGYTLVHCTSALPLPSTLISVYILPSSVETRGCVTQLSLILCAKLFA